MLSSSTLFLGAFVALASAHGRKHRNHVRSDVITLELVQQGATDVKASVSNTGPEAVHLYIDGTILDKNSPVQKLEVTQNGEAVQYLGVIAEYFMNDLLNDSFVTLQPGEAAETVINLPSLYHLTGGDYNVSLTNTFEYAPIGSTSLQGLFEFESNSLTFSISPETAAAVTKALDKRVEVVRCSGERETDLADAISATNRLAVAAAEAAASGDADKFAEYFASTSGSQRDSVEQVFRTLAQYSDGSSDGKVSYSCSDYAGICGGGSGGNIIAYAQPATGRMANCPLFYQLPKESRGCDDQSQAATVLHEFTHVLAKTDDFAYGYDRSIMLSARQAAGNADNYALFADAIANSC